MLLTIQPGKTGHTGGVMWNVKSSVIAYPWVNLLNIHIQEGQGWAGLVNIREFIFNGKGVGLEP